jgi:hypothetical protein
MDQFEVIVLDYVEKNKVVTRQFGKAARGLLELFLHSPKRVARTEPMTQPPNTVLEMQRRAVYLLWQAICWTDINFRNPFDTMLAVPMKDMGPVFEFTIYKALMVYDAKYNSCFAASKVFEVFTNDPLRFLTYNHVLIKGSSQPILGPGDRNVLPYYFSFSSGTVGKFLINCVPAPGSYQFNAVSIVATQWSDVQGRGNNVNAGSFAQIRGVELAGAEIVVTTQFTGCSLCFADSGGSVYAAHIDPGNWKRLPDIGDGNVLARQLCGEVQGVVGAGFSNAQGAVSIYGREKSNLHNYPHGYGGLSLNYFTMIGFYQNGWHIYTQDNNVGKGIYDEQIDKVRQIL